MLDACVADYRGQLGPSLTNPLGKCHHLLGIGHIDYFGLHSRMARRDRLDALAPVPSDDHLASPLVESSRETGANARTATGNEHYLRRAHAPPRTRSTE